MQQLPCGKSKSGLPAVLLTDALARRPLPIAGLLDWVDSFKPPKYLWRSLAALVLGGEVMVRILQGESLPQCTVQCAPLLWEQMPRASAVLRCTITLQQPAKRVLAHQNDSAACLQRKHNCNSRGIPVACLASPGVSAHTSENSIALTVRPGCRVTPSVEPRPTGCSWPARGAAATKQGQARPTRCSWPARCAVANQGQARLTGF